MHYKLGYTQGTYDMFHVGHLNLLMNAKAQCDRLVVGVNTDELVQSYKDKIPVVPEADRLRIIKSIRYVDDALLAHTLDKVAMREFVPFDAIFIGDDWLGNERWQRTEEELASFGAKVIYLPHTAGISSTMLRPRSSDKIED